jgi:hypothetical protein
MKLSQIASQPKLIEVTIDDKDTVKEYGEAITFYTWDRQPMSVFLQLANTDQGNTGEIIKLCKQLILNEDGTELLKDENMIPTKLLMKTIAKVTELLGK